MTARKLVVAIYPDAYSVASDSFHRKTFYAIFGANDGRPISQEWHKTRKLAWEDAAADISKFMMRKLES